jgi:hypothetical protein
VAEFQCRDMIAGKEIRPMKKTIICVIGAVFMLAAIGMIVSADKSSAYYVCNCKDDCKCDFVSGKPGKCNCGSTLVAMHLLAIEKGTGIFCRCGGDCTCERSKTEPGKCGCGKAVKTAVLKGKYICTCGPDCKCNTISDKPGKCHCGKDLKQVS